MSFLPFEVVRRSVPAARARARPTLSCHGQAGGRNSRNRKKEWKTGGQADWLEVNITKDGGAPSRSSAIHQPLCRLRGDHSGGGQAGRQAGRQAHPRESCRIRPCVGRTDARTRTWTRTDVSSSTRSQSVSRSLRPPARQSTSNDDLGNRGGVERSIAAYS